MGTETFFQLQEELAPLLRAGDTAGCAGGVSKRLEAMPRSPFHVALNLSITNRLTDVAAHFDAFFQQESTQYSIAAAYTEMNGFDINPDRWYFDVFAYQSYGGQDDYDWLSDWQSDDFDDMTITGLEPLQQVYAGADFESGEFESQAYVAGLLVVTKFQDLVRRAAPYIKRMRFPLLATAHEYDFIFQVGETPNTSLELMRER